MSAVSAAFGVLSNAGTLAGRLALGALVGLAAAIVMDIPMWRQEEGFTPAYIAASVIRRTGPENVDFLDANLVHHVAGVLSGVLYAGVYLLVDAVIPELPVGGVDFTPHLISMLVVVVSIYFLFSYFVLPRAGRSIYEERATAVRGQWLRSSLVFGVALLVLGPAVFAGLA
ncbi:hypothetical protein GJR99_14385 [Haloferax sp. MBLA0078]|uniref:Uncharacterized protein n=1 Tax=Haloferax marinum TaxID=2666143 RepID=A0A6A8G9K5_9EURY|nr:hypothetical protein Hfx1150_14400 [Haloferax sp. CBA1150]MRW97754.1 hypothetical protein [Haloferax marinum]